MLSSEVCEIRYIIYSVWQIFLDLPVFKYHLRVKFQYAVFGFEIQCLVTEWEHRCDKLATSKTVQNINTCIVALTLH